MSKMKDRIAQATAAVEKIQTPAATAAAAAVPAPEVGPGATVAAPAPQQPRTAPGTLLAMMGVQKDTERELASLRKQLEKWVGAQPTLSLDPARIAPGPFHNRDAETFEGSEWEEFKATIEKTHGNVQPILVRAKEGQDDVYEMVFGRRRTRACAELGLKVLAVVATGMSDMALWEAMEYENAGRANPSPYEQGRSYKLALDAGLFSSPTALAHRIGKDKGLVRRYLLLATLPDEVLGAFPTKRSIQKSWAEKLADAVQKDPDGIRRRAQTAQDERGRMSAREVFEALTESANERPQRIEIAGHDGRPIATIECADRWLSVKTSKAMKLSPRLIEAIQGLLEKERDRLKKP